MTVQVLSLKHVLLPAAWDGDEMSRLQLADGTPYEDMVMDIETALELAVENIQGSYAARLCYFTSEAGIDYGSGNTRGFERSTERARGQGRVAEMVGHMLPWVDFDYQMNFSRKWLANARRSQIDEQISQLVTNAENIFANQVFTRLFKMEEETGTYYGLGNSGVSVPFCDGGNGTIAFTPKSVPDRGGNFAATHDHFLRLDGITQANVETAVEHLWEHGIDGPYELIVAQADVASWTNTTNVTGYVERGLEGVSYGSASQLAQDLGAEYIGGVKTKRGFLRIYATGRIPTAFWSVTVAGEPGDMMNPLAVRTIDGLLSLKLVTENVGAYPLQGATPEFTFGVGVGKRREAAVLVENDSSGDYATPTIS
jgi:hypothetical protein